MSSVSATPVGSGNSRLIVIRNNFGSGKSSLAKAILAVRPGGIAFVGRTCCVAFLRQHRSVPRDGRRCWNSVEFRFTVPRL